MAKTTFESNLSVLMDNDDAIKEKPLRNGISHNSQ